MCVLKLIKAQLLSVRSVVNKAYGFKIYSSTDLAFLTNICIYLDLEWFDFLWFIVIQYSDVDFMREPLKYFLGKFKIRLYSWTKKLLTRN